MLRWYPDPLLRCVLDLTFVLLSLMTVFVVKVLCDGETQWVIGPWSGPGLSADFAGVAVWLGLGWWTVALGWRGAKPPFKPLALGWYGVLSAAALIAVSAHSGVDFRGETIGLRVSLSVLAPAYSLAGLIMTALWVWRDDGASAASRTVSPLQRRNRFAGVAAAQLFVAAAVLFHFELDGWGALAAFVGTFGLRELLRPLDPGAEIYRAMGGGDLFDHPR